MNSFFVNLFGALKVMFSWIYEMTIASIPRAKCSDQGCIILQGKTRPPPSPCRQHKHWSDAWQQLNHLKMESEFRYNNSDCNCVILYVSFPTRWCSHFFCQINISLTVFMFKSVSRTLQKSPIYLHIIDAFIIIFYSSKM